MSPEEEVGDEKIKAGRDVALRAWFLAAFPQDTERVLGLGKVQGMDQRTWIQWLN